MKTSRLSLVAGVVSLALAAVSAQAEITIATVGPMTGPFAKFGEQMRRGAEQAVADLNAKGGVLGQKVRLAIGDDACDPEQAVAVATAMLNKGIRFIAGHFCSGASISASDIYNAEGILQISPASSHPMLTGRGIKGVYRIGGRDDQQGSIAGDYLAGHFGGKKVAIVHDGQAYSKSLAEAAKARLNRRGMNEAMFETVNPGEKSYSALVGKLKRNNIDVLYYGGYHREAGLIVRQMREQGLSTMMISGDDLATGKYWAITGAAGEGTMMTYIRDHRNSAAALSVVESMRKAGFEPEGYTLYTYAAVQVWAQAAAKVRGTDLTKMIKAVNRITFRTVLGEITFNENGDIRQPAYVWYQWRKGKYAEK